MMFLRFLPLVAAMGLLLFGSAGRLDVPQFWAFLVVLWLAAGTLYTVLSRRSPDLVRERLRPPSDRDRATRAVTLPVFTAFLVTAGLDAGRFHWTATPPWLAPVGLGAVAAAMALVGWTLIANPYASSAVRMQSERSQRVITSGPYRWVRHPMYLGVVLFAVGAGPALSSWLAGLLLVPLLGVFVRRTLLEDRMLHLELPGYREYAARVRSRVIPGLF